MSDEIESVTLIDEEGNEQTVEVLEVIGMEQGEYVVLPHPELDNQAVVLRLEESAEGQEELVPIEDEQEWEQVKEEWQALISEE